jgi:hypothetical protein
VFSQDVDLSSHSSAEFSTVLMIGMAVCPDTQFVSSKFLSVHTSSECGDPSCGDVPSSLKISNYDTQKENKVFWYN